VTYLRAALLGFAAALVLGAMAGAYTAVTVAREQRGDPRATAYVVVHGPLGGVVRSSSSEGSAAVYAVGIATGLNCAAFFALVLVPAAVAGLFIKRRITRRD
jgi:hypothetical protein